jgi:N-formylglutamate amidohydrolase
MDIYAFTPGATPLLVSMPHCGTHLPPDLRSRLTAAAQVLPDTDWHVDRLYDFAAGLGSGILRATHSRYVIDLNRPPDDRPLYPGASNTELVPTTLFDEGPVYRPGAAPGAAEIAERLARYWRPYHERLTAELAALRGRFGVALLFDAHSIRSVVPRFFAGRLPDLNLGTGDGRSAAADLTASLVEAVSETEAYSAILNGRFKGGYITRTYGKPAEGIHAVQLELSQATYMDEDPPYAFRDDKAAAIRPILRHLLQAMLDWGAASQGAVGRPARTVA